MANLSLTEARNFFTKQLIASFKEIPVVSALGRSFFPTVETGVSEISIEVERGTELVAVDIIRGAEGNLNKSTKSTERIYETPLYDERINMVSTDVYKSLFVNSNGSVNESQMLNYVEKTAEDMLKLRNKIERAYEYQAWQVLVDGIVTSAVGDNIDFKRKAGSKVTVAGGAEWSVTTVDPRAALQAGCTWLRTNGLVNAGVYNAILGESAFAALIANPKFQAVGDVRTFEKLTMINEPQKNSVGGVFHGQISAGSYLINLWTYPQYYTNSSGVATPYLDPKKVVLLPDTTNFRLAFATCPYVFSDNGTDVVRPMRGAYQLYDSVDKNKRAHYFGVQSSGLAIPVAVDTIYTVKVLA